jgi:PHD/YefM family antitoxin component YafN of YafNO toxin-antitoxin module
MKTVNALTIRNKFGEVLAYLEEKNEPVLITKGKKLRAALVPIKDFQTRFLDKQAEEERDKLLKEIRNIRKPGKEETTSVEALRQLRGNLK